MTCKLINTDEPADPALRQAGDIFTTPGGGVYLLTSVYYKSLELYGLFDVRTGRAWTNLKKDITDLGIPSDATLVASGGRIVLEVMG